MWFSPGPWGQEGCLPALWAQGQEQCYFLRELEESEMSVGMFFQAYATNRHDCFLQYGERAAEK